MLHRSKKTITILFSSIIILCLEVVYLQTSFSMTDEVHAKKMNFVSLSSLPDLAISTEANYVRHRSLSDVFGIYKDDSSLREYFPSTFIISHSHIKKEDI